MAPAWQVREAQQQQFIDRLVDFVHRATESTAHQDFLALVGRGIYNHAFVDELFPRERDFDVANAVSRVVDHVRTFARVESERKYLLSLLFGKLLTTLTSPIVGSYQSDGIHREIEVYGAPRMAEIPYFDDRNPQ